MDNIRGVYSLIKDGNVIMSKHKNTYYIKNILGKLYLIDEYYNLHFIDNFKTTDDGNCYLIFKADDSQTSIEFVINKIFKLKSYDSLEIKDVFNENNLITLWNSQSFIDRYNEIAYWKKMETNESIVVKDMSGEIICEGLFDCVIEKTWDNYTETYLKVKTFDLPISEVLFNFDTRLFEKKN